MEELKACPEKLDKKLGGLRLKQANDFLQESDFENWLDVLLSYYDENWSFHRDEFDGYKARIIQHEYDHLEGILFTDKLSPLKKKLLSKRLGNVSIGIVEVDYKMKFNKKN